MLAQRLELPSRTGIYRILSASCRYQTVENFHHSLCQNRARLKLDDGDYIKLEEALAYYRYGELGYDLRKSFSQLIFPQTPLSHPPCRCVCSTNAAWMGKEIGEVLNSMMEDSTEAAMYIVNSVYPWFGSTLAMLLHADDLQLHIQHFLTGVDDVIREIQQFFSFTRIIMIHDILVIARSSCSLHLC